MARARYRTHLHLLDIVRFSPYIDPDPRRLGDVHMKRLKHSHPNRRK